LKTKQTEKSKVSTKQKQRFIQTLRQNTYKKVKEYQELCKQPIAERVTKISAPDEPCKAALRAELAERDRVKKLYCDDFNLTNNFGNRPTL
jgi:FMN-dependent NADH-azoreductase